MFNRICTFFFPVRKTNGFLHKILKDGKTSYLYSTIHMQFSGTTLLSTEAKSAFETAKFVGFESIIDDIGEFNLQQIEFEERMVQWILENSSAIDVEDNDPSIAHIKSKIPWQQGEPPILGYHRTLNKVAEEAATSAGITDVSFTEYFEHALKNKAEELDKTCFGLENYWDAYAAFVGLDFNYNEQIQIVSHLLPEIDRVSNIVNYRQNIIDAYCAHDLEKLMKISLAKFDNPSHIAAIDRFREKFVNKRDINMAIAMKAHIDLGDAFIAIGASHLLAVIKILSTHGYTIEPINEGPLSHSLLDISAKQLSLNT